MSADVYVLAGAGATVYAFPSQLHPQAEPAPSGAGGFHRRPLFTPLPDEDPDDRRPDEAALLLVLGVL